MRLKKLIDELPVVCKGKDVEITGLCAHSKLVAPGNLFIAKKGTTDDGAKYIQEALSSGAVAVLTDMINPFLKDVAQLIYPNISEMEAILADRYYASPSRSLYTIGVTGTNGKTTITYLLKHLFEGLGLQTGLIGTVEYMIGEYRFAAERTTPDIITNQKLLREMVKKGCKCAVMEVSSHGLDQGRCNKIAFDTAVFSNLTQDHLDYHLSMEAYAQTKSKLFSRLEEDKHAIVNHDSLWKEVILADCKARVISYGFTNKADIFAHQIALTPEKSTFLVRYQNQTVRFTWSLIGRFNLANCLAAIGVCLAKGVALETLPPLISTFQSAPGRLEKVENHKGLNIFVDYAHTPDALENVLACLNELKTGKIFTIFGCGGDRDKSKRAKMGRAAELGSDFVWITSDNPRTEDPQQICQEIASGCTKSNYAIEVDRQRAIEQAIESATPKDLILIAGKGHETYQLFAHQTLPFDDRKVAQEIANRVMIS